MCRLEGKVLQFGGHSPVINWVHCHLQTDTQMPYEASVSGLYAPSGWRVLSAQYVLLSQCKSNPGRLTEHWREMSLISRPTQSLFLWTALGMKRPSITARAAVQNKTQVFARSALTGQPVQFCWVTVTLCGICFQGHSQCNTEHYVSVTELYLIRELLERSHFL